MKSIEELFDEIEEALRKNKLQEIDEIDLYSLDEEWARQPKLYRYWSEKLANAKTLVNILEEKLKAKKAWIDRDIRRRPEHYGLEKVTNEALINIVLIDKDYKEINNMLIEAKYYVDVLFGTIISIEHRRDTLKNEVKLFLNNYYAEQSLSSKEKGGIDKESDDRFVREHIDKLNKNERMSRRIKREK